MPSIKINLPIFVLIFLLIPSFASAQAVIADAVRLTHKDGPTVAEVIVDDSSDNFYIMGNWTAGSFTGGYQDSYYWTGVSDANPSAAYWLVDLPVSGEYDVAVWYSSSANRSATTFYRIANDAGVSEVVIDQTTGGQWEPLGRYSFSSGEALIQLSSRSDPDTIEEILIDDEDSLYEKTGNWHAGTVTSGFLNDYFYASCSSTSSATTTWNLPIMVPGNYELYVYYSPGSNRNSDTKYQVTFSWGTIERTVDQTVGEPGWFGLGNFSYDRGGIFPVYLTNEGPAGSVIISDAIRADYSENQTAIPPVLDVLHDRVPLPQPGESFPVRASVWSASPITEVFAESWIDDGPISRVDLYDDGLHDDDLSGDGIYGGDIAGGSTEAVIHYRLGATNTAGGEIRSTTYQCLVAYNSFTQPELRFVFTGMLKTATDIDAVLQRVRDGNFNALCVNARDVADSIYQSSYEPMAEGVPEGFDPLAYLIEQAHDTSGGKQRIDVHTLVLVYRVLVGYAVPVGHVLDLHPQWVSETYDGEIEFGDRKYIDQGIPEVQDYLVNVFREIIENYDIDGFNLDFIRYRTNYGYNPIALSHFHQHTGRTDRPLPDDPQWSQWKRDQVTSLVRRVYANIMRVKPHVLLTIDGVTWNDLKPVLEDNIFYNETFQDWPGWLASRCIDGVLGMAYRDELNPQYAQEFDEWQAFLQDHRQDRQAVAIVGTYKNLVQHSLVQMHRIRQSGSPWLCFYSDHSTNTQNYSAEDFYQAIRSQLCPTPVDIPAYSWKENWSTGAIMGRVTLDGTPQRLVGVQLGEIEAQTDLAGSYVILNVEPGDFELTVYDQSEEPLATASVSIPSASVVLKDFTIVSEQGIVNWKTH